MQVQPGFVMQHDRADGRLRIRIFAATDFAIESDETTILQTGFEELLALAEVPAAMRSGFRGPEKPRFIVNGWQSWSYAGELDAEERVRPCVLKRFRVFSQWPGPPERRGEVLSHFYVGVRSGIGRFFIVSRNVGTPPIAFRVGREDLGLAVSMLAKGARFAQGTLVAELIAFHCNDMFAARDAFRAVFAEMGTFKRLAFLGSAEGLVPGGYESWYNHYTNIDERVIGEDLSAIDREPNLIRDYYIARGKPTVFQIDDGWEKAVGEWEIDTAKFPNGLSRLAAQADEKNLIPGLWLAPFLVTRRAAVFHAHPEWLLRDARGKPVRAGWNPNWDGYFYALDLSLPEVEEYLDAIMRRVVDEWGFRYLKLDFLYAGFLPGRRARGGAAYEHYERVIGRITSRIADARGRPVAWLGCGAPLESSYRHFPLMRIGADTLEAWEWPILKVLRHEGRPSAYSNLLATFGRSVLDGAVFVNDPDVVFLRERAMRLSEGEKELVALAARLLASQVMFSDNVADFRDPRARAFSDRIVGLYDRLAGREYAAELRARDVFAIRSRDGCVHGIANLSDAPFSAASGEHDHGEPILEHASRVRGRMSYAPHSISLYEEHVNG